MRSPLSGNTMIAVRALAVVLARMYHNQNTQCVGAVDACVDCTVQALEECVWCAGTCQAAPQCPTGGERSCPAPIPAPVCPLAMCYVFKFRIPNVKCVRACLQSSGNTAVVAAAIGAPLILCIIILVVILVVLSRRKKSKKKLLPVRAHCFACSKVALLTLTVCNNCRTAEADTETPQEYWLSTRYLESRRARGNLHCGMVGGRCVEVSCALQLAEMMGGLETILLDDKERGYGLVGAMCGAVGTADASRLAKALVHFYDSHGLAVDMMKALVTLEVKEALSQNTLFRTNSLVTKMFKVGRGRGGAHTGTVVIWCCALGLFQSARHRLLARHHCGDHQRGDLRVRHDRDGQHTAGCGRVGR